MNANRRIAIFNCSVSSFCCHYFFAGRFDTNRSKSYHLAIVNQGCCRRFYPIMIAIFTTIFYQPSPGFATLNGSPKVSKGLRRHIWMADNILWRTNQLRLRKTTDVDKVIVSVGNISLQISFRNNRFIFSQHVLFMTYRQISPHIPPLFNKNEHLTSL